MVSSFSTSFLPSMRRAQYSFLSSAITGGSRSLTTRLGQLMALGVNLFSFSI